MPAQAWVFDQRDQLTTSPNGATYRYDGEGLRTSLTTTSRTLRFTWDRRAGNPVLLTDATNAYVYEPSGVHAPEELASRRKFASAAGECDPAVGAAHAFSLICPSGAYDRDAPSHKCRCSEADRDHEATAIHVPR